MGPRCRYSAARWRDGVVVLDRGNARLSFYRLSEGNQLVLSEDRSLGFQAWDLCTTDGRIFLASDAWETPVVEVTPDGVVLRRFGTTPVPTDLPMDMPRSLQESLLYRFRRGILDCSPSGVTWASRRSGVIYHFTLDGTEIFNTTIPGYSGTEPQLTERRTVRYGPAEGVTYVDTLLEVVHSPFDQVYVQYRRRDYEARTVASFSFVVDLGSQSSRMLPLGDDFGRMHEFDANVVLTSITDPFPQLLIRAVNATDGGP